ncbi:phage recombination protein, RecT family [Campylobacter pinnipediorum subsp. caledonicus]|uniref:Phage recombination protein, RecT family n=1 Tax=Campylobacter pinnipediorum subsp. caledonicus TaxID=1874362 RepID=A0A1S6U614_9BACT|nr:phage recombination protein Bet [Campylobacter pinnipediorum]AQW85590.1 phage recombination protein, RecT family [Campylobacter pinnipediorum subsp. caledonicus]AQW87196.1 phage recombination protein, RecT family [Campylobacter pinnipediorum subsp. caledonicus]
MSNEAMQQNTTLAKNEWLSREEKEIIKKQFFPQNATTSDMIYCMNVAKTFKLNPILKQIFFIERKSQINGQWVSKVEPLAGRDSFLTLAHRSGKFAGIESHTEIKKAPMLVNGEWQEVPELVATACVYRTDTQKPFVCEVSFNEYAQFTNKGDLTSFWRTKPATMLKKVAESQALRKAFDISGLYSLDEVGENETTQPKQQQKQNLNDVVTQKEKDDLNTIVAQEIYPHDELEQELIKRGVSSDRAEDIVSRFDINQVKELLDSPSAIDEILRSA